MNKRKFFLLPICLLLLGACNLSQPESKESKKASEPEVTSEVKTSSEDVVSSESNTTSEECVHEYGDWTTTMRATCTEKGQETRVCSKCGAEENRETDALGHDWDEENAVVVTAPTAEAKGVKTVPCKRCNVTKQEEMEKVQGIRVTFTHSAEDHFKVYVYKTKAYTTETPTEAYSCYARDENGNAIDFDAQAALQPQVSFKLVLDAGYSVGINNIKITGATYKNIKQGPTIADDGVSQDLPDVNHFRITKIQGDITITITPINGEQTLPEVKFVTNHCSVVVYKSQTISDDNIVAEGPFYARDKSSGNEVQTGGQIFFKVVPETGYVWNNGVTAEVGVATLPFIYQKSENSGNKFKPLEDGVYNITKVNDDLSILINCIPEGGEAGLGYEVTFVTEHCSVLVYQTQDYEFTPTAPVDGKALTRTSKGSAAKYVAADSAAGIEEVKPQINFLIVCEDGYTVAKANIVIDGTYNKLEQGDATVNPNIWKATKVKSDLTITITAVLATA